MTTEHYYKGISHVVHLSTDIGKSCEHCSTQIGAGKFAESIKNYITAHGYKLLHAGTETIRDIKENPCHTTIALVGK